MQQYQAAAPSIAAGLRRVSRAHNHLLLQNSQSNSAKLVPNLEMPRPLAAASVLKL